MRWQRGGRLVPPREFIPIAESSGLIGPLTDWVVDEACRTRGRWGTTRRSAVGQRQPLVEPAPPPGPRRPARRGPSRRPAWPADRLVVEITESSLLEIDVARPAIERLSELGVRVAIDDFGIGYSALSYLARLPIDIVKIDRSFVIALEQAGPEEAIASAIIALAKRLGPDDDRRRDRDRGAARPAHGARLRPRPGLPPRPAGRRRGPAGSDGDSRRAARGGKP